MSEPQCKRNKMPSSLDQLKSLTVVVADTGDFEGRHRVMFFYFYYKYLYRIHCFYILLYNKVITGCNFIENFLIIYIW